VSNKRISELTAATTPAETDEMPIVQAATTKKATVSAWVRGALLTGLSTATNAAIAATDSVLVALGKAQAQITGHIGNTTNAHGMTTPGAAIVQAATAADQRAAMGLANHEKVTVNESAKLTANGVYLPDYSIGDHQGGGVFSLVRARYGFGPEIRARIDAGTSNRWLKLGLRDNNGAFSPVLDVYEDRLEAWGPVQAAGNITQSVDNLWSIGTASRRATTAYLATNPVIGSDSRLKCDYSVIPGDIAHELLLKIVPRVGKFIVGGQEAYEVEEATTNEAGEEVTQKVTRYRDVPGNRYHTYYLAQEVKAALDSVADRWPQAANLALWLLSDVEDVDSIQMIRYEQMIPIIHAATVWQWQQK